MSEPPKSLESIPLENIQKLIHDLNVHRVELEIQNEELRRAQDEIDWALSRYSDLYDFAPVGYLTLNKNGLIVKINLTGADMLGEDRCYLIKKGFSSFIAPNFQDTFYHHSKQVFKSKNKQTCQLKLLKKDGTEFYAQIESVVAKDDKGYFSQLRTAITDITKSKLAEEELEKYHQHLEELVEKRTAELIHLNDQLKNEIIEHKQAEVALWESEAAWRSIAKNSPDIIILLDRDWNIQFINRIVSDLMPEEITGTHISNYIPDKFWPDIEKCYKGVWKTSKPDKYEIEYYSKDGSFRADFEARVGPIIRGGDVVALVISASDITERKKTEKELYKYRRHLEELVKERTTELTEANIELKREINQHKQTEHILWHEKNFNESLLETAQTIVLVLDIDGRIRYFNPYMEEISGYTLSEVQGQDWFSTFLPKNEQDKIRKLFLKTIDKNQTKGNINPIITKDGRKRLIEWHDKTLKSSNGDIVGLVATGQDVTKRKEREEKLQRRHQIQSALNAMLNVSLKPYRLQKLLDLILQQIVSIDWISLQARGAIFLLGDHPDKLVMTANRNIPKSQKRICSQVPFEICYCGKAASTKKVQFTDHVGKRHGNRYEGMPSHGHYCVPIQSGNKILGVLYLCLEEGHRYQKEEEDFLLAIADMLAGIIKRKQAEEKLHDYQNQLRKLALELSFAEEQERRRIAVGLHDDAGQSLYLIKMQLETLKGSLSSGDLKSLNDTIENVKQTIHQIRTLTFELSAPILYELGFTAALKWLATQIREQYGIVINFREDKKQKPLDEKVSIFLYQSVRELLINVVKHSQARIVKLSVRKKDNHIQVDVKDDGIGYDPSQMSSQVKRGIGLFFINERLRYIGGHFAIKSKPGHGTRVSLSAPLLAEKNNSTEKVK